VQVKQMVCESPSFKIPCLADSFNTDGWETFKEEYCVIDKDKACDTLVEAIESFSTVALGIVNNSEMSMTSIMDATFAIFVLYCHQQRSRNTTTTTSGPKKPDYSVKKSKSPIFVGEEKLFSNYVKGSYGHDPEKECVEKTPWDRWADFYGSSPFILAYTCIGSAEACVVNVGLLVAKSKSFFSLFEIDLRLGFNRPVLAGKLLKLLPVLAYIHECCKDCELTMGIIQSRETCYCSSIVTSMIVYDRITMLHKKWEFHNAEEASIFHTRIANVQAHLHNVDDMFHATQLTLHDNHKDVSGYFLPVGKIPDCSSAQNVIRIVIAVAKQVQLLISLRIVHNDIRWPNIIESSTISGKYYLVDFDDAFFMGSDLNNKCGGLTHLSEENHCSLVREPHGSEVDIWAIGKLLISNVPTTYKSCGVAQSIMKSCDSLSINDVITSVESLLT